MAKGWGYGKNSMSRSDKIRSGKKIKFENENMKVYEYILEKSIYTRFKDITVKYINNTKDNKKTIVLSGLYKALNYDCSNFNNQDKLFEYVDKLIDEYIKYNTDLEYNHFESEDNFMYCMEFINYEKMSRLESKGFNKLINSFFNCIRQFNEETRIKIWGNIYKNIFNRNEYLNDDIVNIHCKYLELVK